MEQIICRLCNCSVNIFKNKVDPYVRRVGYIKMKNVGLSVSQWLRCPLAVWAFTLDGNLVKSRTVLNVSVC